MTPAAHGAAPSTRRARRHNPFIRAGRHGPLWLFDLDNTLHHASHAIFPRINAAMTAYVARALALEPAEADRLRAEYSRRYGATLLGLIRRNQIDAPAFLREVHAFDDLRTLLRAERGLATLLRALPGRKIVFTNGPREYACDVLEALGIAHLFERVIAIEQMRQGRHWRAKPHVAMLRRALHRLRATPSNAVLVEDTRGHLKRYRRLGLRTVWMVGHLPAKTSAAPRGFYSKPVQTATAGRPHYVDHRVRSLRELRHLAPRSR